jgi:hypothetical protein
MVSPLGWAKTKIGELLREQKERTTCGPLYFLEFGICIEETQESKLEWMEEKGERRGMKKNREVGSKFSKPYFIKTCLFKILRISLFRFC